MPARPARNEEFAGHRRFAPNAGARPLDCSRRQSWGELVHPDSRLAQRTESVPGLGHALRSAFSARELAPGILSKLYRPGPRGSTRDYWSLPVPAYERTREALESVHALKMRDARTLSASSDFMGSRPTW